MSEYGIVWHGMDEFLYKMDQFTGNVGSILGDSTKAAAEATIKEAKPEIPVLTGKTADSLTVVGSQDSAIAEGGEGIEYYAWLEYGGVAGHIEREIVPEGRYLFPASQSIQGEIIEIMEDSLEHQLKLTGLD